MTNRVVPVTLSAEDSSERHFFRKIQAKNESPLKILHPYAYMAGPAQFGQWGHAADPAAKFLYSRNVESVFIA